MSSSGRTIVGLVGLIGAGKTTVARRLEAHGAEVINADELAHQAFADSEVRQQLLRQFGAGIFAADGTVQRKLLAGLVFGATPDRIDNLAALEAIVHPWVRAAIERRLAFGSPTGVVVLDVPLLAQGGWHARCDRLIHIECDDSVRHARLAARGLSPADIAAREAAWRAGFSPAALAGLPGWTVDTSAGLAYTLAQADRVWQELTSRSPGSFPGRSSRRFSDSADIP